MTRPVESVFPSLPEGVICLFKNDYFSYSLERGAVSIIVPVYNTEKYVLDTLNSLMGESLGQHEILIVHDGGTDTSLDIIMDWARSVDNPVAVFDQPNMGLSQARMTGLAHARGDYVAFLDSDDVVTPALYSRMARYAEQEQCDLVICRSAVFDDSNCHISDFYDGWVWDNLLNEAPNKITCLKDDPFLLRLEPNANTRVIKRAFMRAENINFEKGLIFEDLPPHTHEIAAARRVGLLNETGYHYRVNRPGKITQERSQRRFHIFKSVKLAVQNAMRYNIDSDAGAALTSMISRMVFWCGENVLLSQRHSFFEQAVAVYRTIPNDWVEKHQTIFSGSELELKLVRLFKEEKTKDLVRLTIAYDGPVRRIGIRYFLKRIIRFSRRNITNTIETARRLARE